MSNLAEKTALAGESAAVGDLLHLVDVSDTTDNGSGSDRKMTLAEFHETFPVVITTAMTGSGLHATQDKFPMWDNGVPKHILSTELLAGLVATNTTTLAGSGVHATQDSFIISDNGVPKSITSTELCNMYPAVITTALAGSGAHATEDKFAIWDNGVAKHMLVPEVVAAGFATVTTTIAGSDVVGTDWVNLSDAGVPKKLTITELTSAIALLGFTLADIPEYADQAAAATGLTGTGRLFRFATTGALGVTIT